MCMPEKNPHNIDHNKTHTHTHTHSARRWPQVSVRSTPKNGKLFSGAALRAALKPRGGDGRAGPTPTFVMGCGHFTAVGNSR